MIVSNTITMVGNGATVASNLTVKVGETSRLELGVVNLSDGYIQYANNSGSGKMTIGMDSAGGSFAINAFSGGYEDRFIVTNQGYVTKPYQPAFRAYRSTTHTTQSTDVPFNEILLNAGSHYNPANGRFTAPVSGVYVFIETHRPVSGGSATEIEFRKNGSRQSLHNIQTAGNMHQTSTMIIKLDVNDYVTVYAVTNAQFDDGLWDSFSGYLLG